jgi:hypothetical protein
MADRAFRDLGDRLTRALLSGDVALYRSVMALPLRIVPHGGRPYVIETKAALDRDFGLYHDAIRAAGVTDIFREVISVVPAGPGEFRVSLRVHVMARADRIAPPHLSEMLVLDRPDGLRIAEIVAAEDHIDWTLGRGPVRPGGGLL